MRISPSSYAEKEAVKAEDLPAFSGIKLLHIKSQLSEILKLIGRNEIFDQYTKHDIDHVDSMLNILDWLVPDQTKKIMTPADWLMTVLCIYFHDVGMLVTHEEFAQRDCTDFPNFRDQVLYDGEHGFDYKKRVQAITDENQNRDRFLYQEFVRENHAKRIRGWLTGHIQEEIGYSKSITKEIDNLLGSLKEQFRRDLGFVAESHHLKDLNDLSKYRVDQPYGNSKAETANLQYAAVLLRSADLLHITSDRTPGVLYRTINPVDPISQEEWAKQMAVTSVRPQKGINEDGNPDPNVPQDTIEVHAFFKQEDGFFGLTSYLSYATSQLSKCHEWISASRKRNFAEHEFPWIHIDDNNIETDGFMKDAFYFSIDQRRILNLLTGHTLYNDSSVVLRELVQNSLDSIRLRIYDKKNESPGKIDIIWNSSSRMLSVKDNGTGMTQEAIKNHLLRVGASLYQDPEFIKTHPGFSSISRFGIGVLSTFMISDSVEIITCHEDDVHARRLSLRSVHGKYLIRLLEKNSEIAMKLMPSGTLFRLHVRHSATLRDILKIAKYWIVVPGCDVNLIIDDNEPIVLGFKNPKEALEKELTSRGFVVIGDSESQSDIKIIDESVRVVQEKYENATIAYAVKWSPFFHHWSFLKAYKRDLKEDDVPIGTCVEGIRVDSCTPGFTGKSIVSLINAYGESAPRTNVARSGLESGSEQDLLLESVYKAYLKHANKEIDNLIKVRKHSLTWAVQEAQYLLSELWDLDDFNTGESAVEVKSNDILLNCIKKSPIMLIEGSGGREVVSCADIHREKQFWTIECPLLKAAEKLIRESPSSTSFRAIIKVLGENVELPKEQILCISEYGYLIDALAFEEKEVSSIVVLRDQRRFDFAWEEKSDPPRWINLPRPWKLLLGRVNEYASDRYTNRLFYSDVFILKQGVDISGVTGEIAIRFRDKIFLIGESPIIKLIRSRLDLEISKNDLEGRKPPIIGMLGFVLSIVGFNPSEETLEPLLKRFIGQVTGDVSFLRDFTQEWENELRDSNFISSIVASDLRIFDTSMWERRSTFRRVGF